MKEEQPKLVLNKRTVAHLNNLEMRNVRGGDGGGGDVDMSAKACIGKDTTGKPAEVIIDEATTIVKTLTTLLLTRILC